MTFAKKLQESLPKIKPLNIISEVYDNSGKITKGSTDVGDVSWVVPTSGLRTATWVPGTPAHSWQALACGGMSIGKNGMLLAAKALAATAWDLFNEPNTLKAAKKELQERRKGQEYNALLEPGQKPPLDYRNPPKQ